MSKIGKILKFFELHRIDYFSWFGLVLALYFCDEKKREKAFFLKDHRGQKTKNSDFFEAVSLLKDKKKLANNTYHMYINTESLKKNVCLVTIDLLKPVIPKQLASKTIQEALLRTRDQSGTNSGIALKPDTNPRLGECEYSNVNLLGYDILGGYHRLELFHSLSLDYENRLNKASKKPCHILMQKTCNGTGVQVLSLKKPTIFTKEYFLKNWDFTWINCKQPNRKYVSQFKKNLISKVQISGISHQEDIQLDTRGQEIIDFSPSEIDIPFWLPSCNVFHFGLFQSKIFVRNDLSNKKISAKKKTFDPNVSIVKTKKNLIEWISAIIKVMLESLLWRTKQFEMHLRSNVKSDLIMQNNIQKNSQKPLRREINLKTLVGAILTFCFGSMLLSPPARAMQQDKMTYGLYWKTAYVAPPSFSRTPIAQVIRDIRGKATNDSNQNLLGPSKSQAQRLQTKKEKYRQEEERREIQRREIQRLEEELEQKKAEVAKTQPSYVNCELNGLFDSGQYAPTKMGAAGKSGYRDNISKTWKIVNTAKKGHVDHTLTPPKGGLRFQIPKAFSESSSSKHVI